MKHLLLLLVLAAGVLPGIGASAKKSTPDLPPPSLPTIAKVELQPFQAQVRRLLDALEFLGSPLEGADQRQLQKLLSESGEETGPQIQAILDRYCLAVVNINPESRVKSLRGPAKAELIEQGWRIFLMKVHNEAGVTGELKMSSPNAQRLFNSPAGEVRNRWLEIASFNNQPMNRDLSGLLLEYRIVQLYSRDDGKREAKLAFDVGQGTQDLGFRNELDILFNALPGVPVTFEVRDEKGKPTTGCFVIRDQQRRVYPAQGKRLAPDFAFHPQIYRADGESIILPAGTYQVEFSRGPESIPRQTTLVVGKKKQKASFQVERWIDPSTEGWWSGDHHIHAAGCAHYTNPTEGVHAPDMIRHCLGEDLKVGCNLTWGPCFDYQKQFFTGKIDKVSKYPYLLRYDIEVSGFGSHQSGHLCLLRLKDQMYPGGDSMAHWPSLCLNTLRWAKKQGAVCGPAHSGWGLEVKTSALPNYEVPPFSGIGANEYIVDVTHEVPGPDGKLVPAVDFLSMVDTPYVWELNIWYHTLNCGFRTRISGETDFPCIYGERVGLGRSYVKLDGNLDFDRWCEGIRQGRNYVSDGKSHLLNLKANGIPVGEQESELRLDGAQTVRLEAKVAARLEDTPREEIRSRQYSAKPYWDLERARIGNTREVPVELIVNGYPVAQQKIIADGQLKNLTFTTRVERSSWVALRILPSSHSNPFFVLVDGKPIRASRRSAEWCLKGVDQCWSQKDRFIKSGEKEQAKADYEHARQAYRKILAESTVD